MYVCMYCVRVCMCVCVCVRVCVCVCVCEFSVMQSTSEYGDGGGLSSSIMAQESSDLTLVHVEVEFVDCNFFLL